MQGSCYILAKLKKQVLHECFIGKQVLCGCEVLIVRGEASASNAPFLAAHVSCVPEIEVDFEPSDSEIVTKSSVSAAFNINWSLPDQTR